jgi:hypothetical protein
MVKSQELSSKPRTGFQKISPLQNISERVAIGDDMEKRICSKCGLEKDIDEFRLRNRFTRRRQSYCIECGSKMGANWYQRNKEYQKANARKHTKTYRDTIRQYL